MPPLSLEVAFFNQRQDIVPVDVFVFDGIHDVLDHVDAKPADLAFIAVCIDLWIGAF